ncbi:MAG: DUF4405 domain-containing protein [Eubacteriales bacterium]|nr:DUF4405 domain-containing protein [Eubacteriales bacterium]
MKAKSKITIDVLMTLLFLMQMGYHMLDNRAHEWVGITLFALFCVHHILNGGWYRSLFRGKWSAQRVLLTAVDVLLTLVMVAIIVSALFVSRHVFSFLGLHLRALGRRIHMPATMWGFVLMGLHLGLHWNRVLAGVRRRCHGKGSRAAVLAARIALLLFAAFGVYEFVTRELWMELFSLREFAFLEYGETLPLFFASYVAILAVWAACSYYLNRLLRGKRRINT